MSKKDKDANKVPIEFEALVEEDLQQEEPVRDMMDSDIEALRKSLEESQNGYLRVLADFDNFRQRQREETARLTSSARENLILKLLPMVDNFDRTLQATEAEHSYESLVEGVTLTLKHIREMLEKEGLEPIEAVGQEFNPELHDALMRVETDEYPDNTIVDEIEKGYMLNGKVLRPSRVRVAAKG